MKLLPDDKLTTREQMIGRIQAIERKRDKLREVQNPRDWRKRADESTSLRQRADALRERCNRL